MEERGTRKVRQLSLFEMCNKFSKLLSIISGCGSEICTSILLGIILNGAEIVVSVDGQVDDENKVKSVFSRYATFAMVCFWLVDVLLQEWLLGVYSV